MRGKRWGSKFWGIALNRTADALLPAVLDRAFRGRLCSRAASGTALAEAPTKTGGRNETAGPETDENLFMTSKPY